MKHTATPWEICNNYIKKVGGAVIATTARNNAMCRFEAEPGSLADAANAEFICRAVNNHERLLNLLNKAVNAIRVIHIVLQQISSKPDENIESWLKEAKAAIEAAGGEDDR